MQASLLNTIAAVQGALPQEYDPTENIYVVLAVTMIVWVGLFVFLMIIDRKVNVLSQKVELIED